MDSTQITSARFSEALAGDAERHAAETGEALRLLREARSKFSGRPSAFIGALQTLAYIEALRMVGGFGSVTFSPATASPDLISRGST